MFYSVSETQESPSKCLSSNVTVTDFKPWLTCAVHLHGLYSDAGVPVITPLGNFITDFSAAGSRDGKNRVSAGVSATLSPFLALITADWTRAADRGAYL